MARDADVLGAVNRIFCTEIDRLLQRLGEERGIRRGPRALRHAQEHAVVG